MLIQRCRQEIMSSREFSLTIRKAQLNGAKKYRCVKKERYCLNGKSYNRKKILKKTAFNYTVTSE